MPRVWVLLILSFFKGCHSLPCAPYVFRRRFMNQSAGKIAREGRCHNFDPDLAPSHGACQGTSTPAGPSARDTRTSQNATGLRILFWLGRAIWAYVGRGWQHQCVLASMETSLMLSSFPRGVTSMWRRRILRRVCLILLKRRLVWVLSCNRFMARRQRIESVGAMKKTTCLLYHPEKLRTRRKMIRTFFVALESQLMTEMILHQRMPLNSKSNRKGTYKKVAGCGNQRALYALVRRTMFKILLGVFRTTCKRRCQRWAS